MEPQAPNMTSVLDRPSNTIERPKPLPVGTFRWQVKGQPRFDKSSQKKTDFVEYTVVPLEAGEDVDADALAEALTVKGTGEKKSLSEKQMKLTYYLTDDALWRLKDFLDHCGVEDPEGATIGQRIPGAAGTQFLGSVRHKPTQDGQNIFAEIGQTAPVQ